MRAEVALQATEGLMTPVGVVDEVAMEANLARMAALASSAGLALRPHAKTHKSAFVAQRQLAHGARGLTAATLTEAEVFAGAGAADLLVAHPPAGDAKRRRLANLAERVERLAVSLDEPSLAAGLPALVEVMWEVDTGLHRVGTVAGAATVEGVQRLLEVLPPERFRGLLTHAGHVYTAPDQEGRRAVAREEWAGLVESAELLRARGITVAELSVGTTPTAMFAEEARGITEMRPGVYVYGDAKQVGLGTLGWDECALAVVAMVVSAPERDRAVVDAGSKALSPDSQPAGVVLGRPELALTRVNEEHSVVSGPHGWRVGERVVLIPGHACTCVNLHAELLFIAPDATCHWDPVAARSWTPIPSAEVPSPLGGE